MLVCSTAASEPVLQDKFKQSKNARKGIFAFSHLHLLDAEFPHTYLQILRRDAGGIALQEVVSQRWFCYADANQQGERR